MQRVGTGIDRVARGDADLPCAARLSVLTNEAARTTDGRPSWSVLRALGYRIAFLLTPEHGMALEAAAGDAVGHSTIGGLPVYSLYGADTAPVETAMREVDALVVDLPDVGCRYYTYPWTVRETLKLAARHAKPVYLLDRPNPLGGVVVEGNLPDEGYDSAVCASHVPVRHGLTPGELAIWNRRDLDTPVELVLVEVVGWERGATWFETSTPWVAPSPAIVDATGAFLYPGTCLLEGTNVSEGRGTDAPFALVGAPFVVGAALAADLAGFEELAGIGVEPVSFTPRSSKWEGERCEGVRLTLRDRARIRPVAAGLAIVAALCTYERFSFRPSAFDSLAGTSTWREQLTDGTPVADIVARWHADEDGFISRRSAILRY